MSDLDAALKQSVTPCITLGIQASSQLITVLRDFLDYWYLTAMQTAGSEKYSEFLKQGKGAYFRDEMEFAKVTFDLHKSDLYREPVSKEERAMLAKMCQKMGVDYCLAKRPQILEELITRKYVDHQPLSPQEEKIVNAFICLNEKGEPVFETEDKNGNRIPMIRNDEYLLTIAENDLPKWDLICTYLESVGKRSLEGILRDVKVQETIRAQQAKEQKEISQGPEIGSETVSFFIPKSRIIPEKNPDVPSETVKIRVTAQDYIIIPAHALKDADDDKGCEIVLPESYEVTIVSANKTYKRPIADIPQLIPVQRTTAERSR